MPPRREIVAGVELLDLAGTGRLTGERLVTWLEDYGVEVGGTSRSRAVYEHGMGAIALRDLSEQGEAALARMVETVRDRVLLALRGLLGQPSRDGFVVAALVQGRVRRDSQVGTYLPTMRGVDALSDVVLAFFAADILGHREEYDANLRICDVCGRVSLDADGEGRRTCAVHAAS